MSGKKYSGNTVKIFAFFVRSLASRIPVNSSHHEFTNHNNKVQLQNINRESIVYFVTVYCLKEIFLHINTFLVM